MSKVEVKKSDRWTHCNGVLAQIRTDKDGLMAARFIYPNGIKPWVSYEDHEASGKHCARNEFDAARAPLWLQGMGYTVVEEREEEKPNTLLVKIYRSTHDGSLWMIDSPTHSAPSDYVFIGTTTIHIAGVTT